MINKSCDACNNVALPLSPMKSLFPGAPKRATIQLSLVEFAPVILAALKYMLLDTSLDTATICPEYVLFSL